MNAAEGNLIFERTVRTYIEGNIDVVRRFTSSSEKLALEPLLLAEGLNW